MSALLEIWPNVLFAITVAAVIWRYLKWVNFGFGPTPSERARDRGELILDDNGEFIEEGER